MWNGDGTEASTFHPIPKKFPEVAKTGVRGIGGRAVSLPMPITKGPQRVKADERSDEQLVAAWLGGDADAFAAVYDRYSGLIYAFALSRLRTRSEAADVAHDTFVRAADRLAQLRDPSRLRPWLYAIARNRVVDSVRHPLHIADAQEFADMPSDRLEPADTAISNDNAELVWLAADGLNDRDRELLNLHLRHGLDGTDLADVVGMSPSQVHVAMNRLKDRMAKAVGALLIARHGSTDCRELGAVLADWDGTFSLDVRSKVTRHVEGCDTCRKRRALLIAPSNFSAGAFLVPVLAPAALRETTLQRVAQARIDESHRLPDHRSRWRRDGFPHPRSRTMRRSVVLLTAASLVAASLAILTVAARGNDQQGPSEAASSTELDVATNDNSDATSVPSLSTDEPPTATSPVAETGATTTVADPSTTPQTTVAVDGTEVSQPAAPTAAVPADSASASPFGGPQKPGGIPQSEAAVPSPTSVVQGAPSVGTAPPATSPATGSASPSAPPASAPSPNPSPSPTTAPFVEPIVTTSTAPAASPPTQPAPQPTQPTQPAPQPSVPPAAPPPPAAGMVVVITGPIDLGASQASGTVRIRNEGGQSIGWSATSSIAAFTLSSFIGSLAPGQEATIQVTVNRTALSEGSHTANVTVSAASGGGSSAVSARVERIPVISSFVRTPPVIRTSNSCGASLTNVTVSVSDESGIASVEILWSSDGSFAQRTALTPNGARTVFSGQIGSFSRVGSNTLTAHVVDTRGNLATASTTVSVVAC